MFTFMTLIRWVHIMGAVLWVGGLAFVVLILRPALRRLPEAHVRRFVLGQVVTRMRRLINVVITLQVATGLYQAWLRLGSWEALFASAWGQVLLWKVLLAAIMIGLYLVVPNLLLHAPAQTAAAGAYECPTEEPGPQQKLGQALHVVLLALGFAVILLAKLLT